MRNKISHQYLQHKDELEEQNHYNRSKFLPMLCSSSTSTKQVMIKLSDHRHRRSSSTSSTASSTVSDEPLSPRVGCMGQVKRNNKVVGFPSNNNTNITKSDQLISKNNNYSVVKYYKLKRFFSTKSFTGSPTTVIAAATATAVTRSGTHKGKVKNGYCGVNSHNKGVKVSTLRSKIGSVSVSNNNDKCNENVKGCLVNLVELDPPLPVVKQLQGSNNGESVSLWKRRSGGTPLKSLHVQAVPQSCNLLLQATTV